MLRRRISLLVSLALIAGCSAGDSTAPAPRSARASSHDYRGGSGSYGDRDDDRGYTPPPPGSIGNAATASGSGNRLPCDVPSLLTGSAEIGPEGGTLDVGPHRLIIPAGALTTKVQVSGFVPAGPNIEIHFEPHGLQFRKPAGLVLNVASCGNVPDVVYLNEVGVIAERIKAIFSSWWHAVAAPIDHFSVYALEV
jgi:hypothetical protein